MTAGILGSTGRVLQRRPRAPWGGAACLVAAVFLSSLTGCSSAFHPAAGRPAGVAARVPIVGDRIEKQRLRQEVDADDFPTAAQAGL